MVKLVYCITKKDDVDIEEFYRIWLEEHGPLVKSVAESLHAARYVQSHTVMPEINELLKVGRGLQDAFVGITEMWWHSKEDFDKALQTPEGREAAALLVEDESRFINFGESRVFMTEEHQIF